MKLGVADVGSSCRCCSDALCVLWSFLLSASSKTISGLLEFDSKTEAVEVLTVLNHYQIRIPSRLMEEMMMMATSVVFCGGARICSALTCALSPQMDPTPTP